MPESMNAWGKCCCMPGCSNRYAKYNGLHYYRLSVDINRRNAWIAAIFRKDRNTVAFAAVILFQVSCIADDQFENVHSIHLYCIL